MLWRAVVVVDAAAFSFCPIPPGMQVRMAYFYISPHVKRFLSGNICETKADFSNNDVVRYVFDVLVH